MAIFLRRDGMELETKEESIEIDDLPAVQVHSIAHDLQNMPEKSNGCQSISPSIKNQVSTTIRKPAQTNDYLPKDSLTIIYFFSCPKNLSSPTMHRSCYRERSSGPLILPSIRKSALCLYENQQLISNQQTSLTRPKGFPSPSLFQG